jgi:hypothetical protein
MHIVLVAMTMLAGGRVPCAADDMEVGNIGRAEVGEDFAEEFR